MNSPSVRESWECETFQFKTFCVTRSIKMGQSQNVSYSIAIAQTEFMTHFYKNKIDKERIDQQHNKQLSLLLLIIKK